MKLSTRLFFLFIVACSSLALLPFFLNGCEESPCLDRPRLPDQALFNQLHLAPLKELVLVAPSLPLFSSPSLPLSLVMLVPSHVSHFSQRSLIRSLWAHPRESTGISNGSARVIFLVGREEQSRRRLSTEREERRIQEEAAQLGDILQVDVKESYRQLVYKELVGFRWLAEMTNDAAFVMKADEDTVVDVDRLLSHLRFSFPSTLGRPSISCIILQGIPPRRSPCSQWFVPEEVFGEAVFPAYCNGPVYVMRRQTLASLVDASRSLKVFEVEDAFWTGVAARAAGVRRSCAAGVFSLRYETTSACGLFPGGSPALSAMPSHSHPEWNALSPSLALNSTWQTLRGVACRSTLAEIAAGFMSIFECL